MADSTQIGSTDAMISKIRSIPMLSPFSERDLKGLLKLSRMIKYAPGDKIIEEGQLDDRIYFLIRGEVQVEKQGEAIGVLRRTGDLFGEMGVIDGSPRSATIISIDDAVCLVVDVSYMDRLKGHEKTAFTAVLYRLFAEILCNRLRQMDDRIIALNEENSRLKYQLEKLTKKEEVVL
jgi:CRP-like cAMP-binding protein